MAHCRFLPAVSKVLYALLFMGLFVGLSGANSFPNVPQCYDSNGPHCVYIDPQNGFDNKSCLTSNNSSIPCKHLSWVLNETYQSNNIAYVLSNGTHLLSQPPPTFQNVENITLVGDGISSTTVKCTAKGIGLSFVGSANLVFSNFGISNCAALRNGTSKTGNSQHLDLKKILVALYFYSCENLSMNYLNVSNSPNATGVVVYDTIGVNTVSNSVFSHNNASHATGGGGFYVEFTFCIPGDNSCSNNATSHTSHNQDSTYTFDNCRFLNNTALGSEAGNTTYLVPHRSNHVTIGRGGGLSIFFKGNATGNRVSIRQCHFEYNVASWGAGLFVEFQDDTASNIVEVDNCTMARNVCPFTVDRGTAGGGMRLSHYVFGQGNYFDLPNANQITITNCIFSYNAALNGGGLSISPTVQNVDEFQVAKILIDTCTFTRNIARLGAALHISRFAMILDGTMLSVVIRNSEFRNNSVDFVKFLHKHLDYHGTRTKAYQPGLGAVYVNQVPVSFPGNVSFIENNGSALVAFGAALNFSSCKAYFYVNRGTRGGAIALLGLAWLRIDDFTNMQFASNLATADGGAIYNKYIERENLISYGNCFIRHTNYGKSPEDWLSYFSFWYNYDQNGDRPSAIYSTSVVPCAWAGGSLVNTDLHVVFCWNQTNWSYLPDINCSSHIHSDIGNVTFTHSSNIVHAFPGRQFQIPISLSDDLHHSLSHDTVFSVTFNNHQNDSVIKYFFAQQGTVSGKENTTSKLQLDTFEDRDWHIVIEVRLTECPPGFAFNGTDANDEYQNCKCLNNGYSGAVFCDPQQKNAYLKNNTWMGLLDDKEYDGSVYVYGLCPPGFCFSNVTQPLPNSSTSLQNLICGTYNRNGTLCGRCSENFTVTVNSLHYVCIDCSDENLSVNILKYIAAIYLPLTLLFLLIIFFNIRLTSAPANAFILFGQLVASTFDLNADDQIPSASFAGIDSVSFTRAYKAIYGIFNLEFIENFLDPLCIGELETLSVIALDYIVALFPLVMILLILLAYRMYGFFSRCRCCRIPLRIRLMIHRAQYRGASVSSSMLPAFATYFLLSYSKFSTVSSFLVVSQSLFDGQGKAVQTGEGLRVYYNGSYSFYDSHYQLLYLTPASIVFATFVAIPTVLLLDFPMKAFEKCLSKVRFLWQRYPVDKVHILLDTFQGCFKNRMRFFAGLYFLFRLLINMVYNVTDTWLSQYLIQQIACIVMIALLLVCQPYNKENWMFNIVDPLMFANLAILNAISFYVLSITSSSVNQVPQPHVGLFAVQCILLLIPLLYMLSYITWYLLRPYKKRIKRKLLDLKARVIKKDRQRVGYQIVGAPSDASASSQHAPENYSDSSSDREDEVLLKRAESRNTYRPRTSALVGIDEMENESASKQAPPSTDSGLRSTASNRSNEGYSSTGTSTRSSDHTKASNN